MTVDPLPDWAVSIPSAPVHQAPAGSELTRPFTVQQLIEIGKELIEQFLRRVVLALTGFHIPGLPSFDQLRDWAENLGDQIVSFINTHAGINLASWDALLASLEDGKGIDLALIPQFVRALEGIPWESGDPGAILRAILEAGGSFLRDLFRTRVPIGLLTDATPNLVWEGAFEAAETIAEGSEFFWDEISGGSGMGSASVVLDGQVHEIVSDLIEVSEGDELTLRVLVRWRGLVNGEPWSPFLLAGITRLDGVSVDWPSFAGVDADAPADSSSADNDFVPLTAVWTVPAGVNQFFLRLSARDHASAGQVWFKDASVRKTQKMPQRFTDMLPEDLASLLNHIALWVDSALDALNIPKFGSLADRILDLSDEMEWLQARGQDVQQLLSDLLSNPAAVLGQLPQALVAGLTGAVSELNQIRDIFAGIVVTPINSAIQDIKDWFGGLTGKTSKLAGDGTLAKNHVNGLVDDLTSLGGQITSGIGGIINGIVNGWQQGSPTGADPDVYQTIETIRLMVSGEWTIETLTVSGTWDKPTAGTITEFWAIGVGGGGRGATGQSGIGVGTSFGGPGGSSGSYEAIQIDPADLGASVPYSVGAAGASPGASGTPTTFGSWLATTPGGAGGIASPQGYMLTTSRPGAGGAGGECVRTGTGGGDHSATAGTAGESSALGAGGVGGALSLSTSGSGTGGSGGPGGNASVIGQSKSGGGGGGGGGGCGRASATATGGPGGNGGYPGGASGGGGGARATGLGAKANGGAPGTPGNGLLFLLYKVA